MSTPTIAFLFPGQGSQYIGMGKDFYENFPTVKTLFEEASDSISFNFKKQIFDGLESDLKLTKITQPSLLLISYCIFKTIQQETGCKPHVVAGHSLGEYSALVSSGAINFQDGIKLVHKRGAYMQEAVPEGQGAMAAIIGNDVTFVNAICLDARTRSEGEVVEVANINSDTQIVISGSQKGIETALESAKTLGAKRVILLNVSAPFHCSLMKGAEEKMKREFEHIKISPLEFPFIANVDATYYCSYEKIVEKLIDQICNSVLWYPSMKVLLEKGVTHFYEIGPQQVLTSLMKRINKDVCSKSISTVDDLKILTF